MSERVPVEWTPLTPEEWAKLPRSDHTTLFSREEVTAALNKLTTPEEAEEIARELYSEPSEPGTIFFYGDLLTVLASLSESAADRVRSVLATNPESTA